MTSVIESPVRARRAFRADRRGTASVEFAFIAPILITMYFGVVELSLAIQASRKVTSTASAVGDLVAQTDRITPAEVDAIFDAADAIMQPLDSAPLQVRVSALRMELDGDIEVIWSRARNTTAHGCGATLSPPDAVLSPGQSIVMAEVSYNYVPPLGYQLTGDILLDDIFYLRPRQSLEVTLQPVQCP
jgi:Flp pilus assembly protein TadG